jgi:HNH endonuclease.
MSIQNPDEIQHIEGQPCRRCGTTSHINYIRHPGWPGGHWGRVHCKNCDTFIKWASKPTDKKTKRSSSHKRLVSLYSHGFCVVCLRQDSQIPAPQTLEAHHIIPVADGGTDDQGNIMICCTACHKLIHWQRTYLGHTVQGGQDESAA